MKTGKKNKLFINERLQKEISFYTKNMNDVDYMFPSRKGNSYIDRDRMFRIVKAAAIEVGVKDNIGAHSLRKTFGYHHYKKHHDIAFLMDVFNHSSMSITLRYIGISQDDIIEKMSEFHL